jgi:hypothetical protein
VNAAGAAADPTTVTFKYRIGAAAIVTAVYPAAPIVKDSIGNYHANFDTSGWAGPDNLLYATEWFGTGAVLAINDDYWQVTPPAL